MIDRLFTSLIFWRDFLWGVLQAGCVTGFALAALESNFPSPQGFTYSDSVAGVVALTGCVLVANCKLLLFAYNHTVLLRFCVIGSIAIYFVTFSIVSAFPSAESYGVFGMY
jgi:hypothetical protein